MSVVSVVVNIHIALPDNPDIAVKNVLECSYSDFFTYQVIFHTMIYETKTYEICFCICG